MWTSMNYFHIPGSLGCVKSLLEAGAKTYHTNTVGRNAAQMAGFVGMYLLTVRV